MSEPLARKNAGCGLRFEKSRWNNASGAPGATYMHQPGMSAWPTPLGAGKREVGQKGLRSDGRGGGGALTPVRNRIRRTKNQANTGATSSGHRLCEGYLADGARALLLLGEEELTELLDFLLRELQLLQSKRY